MPNELKRKNKRRVDVGAKNYKDKIDELKTAHFKTSRLGNWVKFHSNNLVDDNKQGYPMFERGALVKVDFGINVGSEFSGTHFGIVVDKTDSSIKELITVLPLTSVEDENNLNIGKSLYESIIEETNLNEKGLQFLNYDLNYLYDEIKKMAVLEEEDDENVTLQTITDMLKRVKDGTKYINEMGDFFDATNPSTSLDENKKSWQEVYDKHNSNYTDGMAKCAEVRTYYTNYDKNSNVKVNNIITLSKKRIKRKINDNEFDPIGKAKVSDKTMALIDEELRRFFV